MNHKNYTIKKEDTDKIWQAIVSQIAPMYAINVPAGKNRIKPGSNFYPLEHIIDIVLGEGRPAAKECCIVVVKKNNSENYIRFFKCNPQHIWDAPFVQKFPYFVEKIDNANRVITNAIEYIIEDNTKHE